MDIVTKFWVLGPNMVKIILLFFSSLKFKVSGGCLQVVGQLPDHLRLLCLLLNPVDRHGQVQVHPAAQAQADIYILGKILTYSELLFHDSS